MEPGRVLADRYEIRGPIADGSGSTVWEAWDRGAGELTAVKAVSLERAGWRAEVRDRFQQEARLLTLVRHRNVVGVRDVGETDDGYLYVVLDRLSGETLANRLARAPRLTWREAAAVAGELASGLAALHARGIVHRDLKPANVILHPEAAGDAPVCKIIDLGISKVGAAAADPVLFATLTATGQVLGTPEYMSYEQAVGERDVDARTDVWALGVVLYEMLSGRRPFTGGNVNAVLAAIRRQPPAALSTVARGTPDALAAVVHRCLDTSRDGRYRDAEALGEALRAAVARGEREEARATRRKTVMMAGSAALVVVVASLAVAMLARRPSPPAPPAASATVDTAPAAPPPTATPTAPEPAPPTSARSPAAAPTGPASPRGGRAGTRVNRARF